MELINITNALSINVDHIDQVLFLPYYVKSSKTNNTYNTIKNIVIHAKRHYKYYDYTNNRDGVKTIIILINGDVCALSLSSEKLLPVLKGKTSKKNRTGK